MCYLQRIEECQGSLESALQVLASLNLNQLEHLDGEIFAQGFWFNKKANFITTTADEMSFLNSVSKEIQGRIKDGNFKHEINEYGLIVKRSTCIGELSDFERAYLKAPEWTSLLDLDFCHAYWVNRKTLTIASYCEHDIVFQEAADLEQLERAITGIKLWFKENY